MGQRAPQVATQVVLPTIERALAGAGISRSSTFHVVTHSLGGLLLRYLLEHPDVDADEPLADGSWRGDGRSDGDPTLRDRVLSLVLLSTPNQGARTGIAQMACNTYPRGNWRPLSCDILPEAPFQQLLGARMPGDLQVRYLAIGVEAAAPLFPALPYDGDGDGRGAGHDNAVMAEAVRLAGAPFAVWRGWEQSDHFHATCSTTINEWILGFVTDGTLPPSDSARHRGANACQGLPKGPWRAAWDVRQAELTSPTEP